jgi:hypothetical protein
MELVKGNMDAGMNETTGNKTKDLSAEISKALAPYLKEGVDAAKVSQEVEVAMIRFGSRTVTDFLLNKFRSL